MTGCIETRASGASANRTPPGDRRQDQASFHLREPLADAHPRAAPERDVRVPGPAGVVLEPALGTEGRRVRPPTLVVVQEPRRHEHHVAGVDRGAGEVVLRDGLAADQPSRGPQADRLREDGVEVREPDEVGDRRRPSREHRIEFGAQPLVGVGVLRQQPPRPGQGVRRRLVPGEEQRDRLVPDLAVVHPPSALVGRQQQRQEVVAVGRGALALDHPVDDLVEHGDRSSEPSRRRDREPRRDGEPRRELAVELREHLVHRGADRLDIPVRQIRAEQRSRDDREREPRHRLVHVDGNAGREVVRRTIRLGDDRGGVAVDPLVMEDRLDQPALPPMVVALAREESVAEHASRVPERRALAEVAIAGAQDVPHEVGMVHEREPDAGHRDPHDVAGPRRPLDQPDRVAA